MRKHNNADYTYEQVLNGIGYYSRDDLLRYSEGVKTLQEKLNAAGFICGTPDGRFGENTSRAVYQFQTAYDLKADRLAGKDTLTRLAMIHSGSGGCNGDILTMKERIVREAEYWIGKIPYCINSLVTTQVLYRDAPPPYMDCSDFTSSVYLTVLGIHIGINTKAQIRKGVSVPADAMEPGDLIFFDWNGNGLPDHVGICSARNEMIDEHGSNSDPDNLKAGENVRRKSLSAYHRSHILDVRRII